MTGKQIGTWAGGIAATITVIVAMAWGVPWHITGQVSAAVAAELSAMGPNATMTANSTRLNSIDAALVRIEARQIASDKFILDYFANKANN